MKKLTILCFVALCALFFYGLYIIYQENTRLNTELADSKSTSQKIQDQLTRIKIDYEKIAQAKEKLEEDAVSYVAMNTKSEREQEELRKSQQDSLKTIAAKEKELIEVKKKISYLDRSLLKQKERADRQEIMLNEMADLKKTVIDINAILKKEKALYHYNLGVAFSRAKLYNESIAEYEAALEINPDNPEAHYNAGLLYDYIKDNLPKAIEHYRRYLELSPYAEDKDEVKGWVAQLEKLQRWH